MNRSFENIFEKYNINCEISKRRNRSHRSQSVIYHKKELALLNKSSVANSMSGSVSNTRKSLSILPSCCFNTLSKAKYKHATKYSTLEIIGVQREAKFHNIEISFNKSVSGCESKENKGGKKSPGKERKITKHQPYEVKNYTKCGLDVNINESATCHDNQTNVTINFKERLLDSSEVKPMYEANTSNCPFAIQSKLQDKELKENQFLRSEHNQSFEGNSSQPPVSKDPHLLSTQRVPNCNTELDLLIDLIEQDEKYNKKYFPKNKENGKLINCDSLLRIKPCLKDGFQEMFERALKREKVKSNFLKYDKKIGLRIGQLLTVVKIETTHGLTLASVKGQDLNKNFAVVVSQEMMPRLKLGAQVETFFDDKTLPYKLLLKGEYFDVFLEPYKLLIA